MSISYEFSQPCSDEMPLTFTFREMADSAFTQEIVTHIGISKCIAVTLELEMGGKGRP
jgi:hypothetical protein